jgi:branched-chain amino acid transport system permease protein
VSSERLSVPSVSLGRLRAVPIRYYVAAAAVVALLVLPMGIPITDIVAVTGVLYLMMFAMSWDAVSGYTGQLSFGHAVFFTAGAYGSAILNVDHGVHPFASILLGAAIATLAGFLIGFPALRLSGPYLSLVTLVAPLIMLQVFILFSDTFRGSEGFAVGPDPLVGTRDNAVFVVEGFETSLLGDYYAAVVLLLLIAAVLYVITRSTTGAIFTAIREDERAVESVGLNPAKYKIFAFVLSSSVGGLAGAMYVHSKAGHPQPQELLVPQVSIDVIVMTVIGGMGTIVGAAVGAAFFVVMSLVLGYIPVEVPILGETLGGLSPIPVLALAIGILYFMPQGILPAAISAGERLKRRLVGGSSTAAEDGEQEGTPLEQTIEKFSTELRELSVFGDD